MEGMNDTVLMVKEFCERVRDDAYGGAAELVDDAILALINELRDTTFRNGKTVCEKIESNVDAILDAADSILPLINLLIRCMSFAEENAGEFSASVIVDRCIDLLTDIRQQQSASIERIGSIGEKIIRNGDRVSTFSTSGSVMAILAQTVKSGKTITATAFEARPHNEGYRTLKEISEMGIQVTFGVDALLCHIIPGSNLFVIGADAVLSTGEVYAKTGSYSAALACHEFGVPFYVAADTSKFDMLSLLGFPLKDSSRPPEEVTGDWPENSKVINVSFELIPPRLITGVITEKGLVSPYMVASVAEKALFSDKSIAKLAAWLKKD